MILFIRKYKYVILFCAFVSLFIFRNSIAATILTFEPTSYPPIIKLEDDVLADKVNSFIKNNTSASVEEVINFCLTLTSEYLSFTTSAQSINPNDLRVTKETHCVGYSAFLSSTLDYCILNSRLRDKYEVQHSRGKVHLAGFEITNQIENSFLKDHDFVEVKSIGTSQKIILDPSLHEFFRIGIMK